MSALEFPSADAFFGTYLHQDWDMEYGSIEEAIADFVEHSAETEVTAVARDLAALRQLDEVALERTLGRFGSGTTTYGGQGPHALIDRLMSLLPAAAPRALAQPEFVAIEEALALRGRAVIAGAPGSGKTMLALSFAERAAASYPGGTHIYSASKGSIGLVEMMREVGASGSVLLVIDEFDRLDQNQLTELLRAAPASVHLLLVGVGTRQIPRTLPHVSLRSPIPQPMPEFEEGGWLHTATAETRAVVWRVLQPYANHTEVVKLFGADRWPALSDAAGHPIATPESVPEIARDLSRSAATFGARGVLAGELAAEWLRQRGARVADAGTSLHPGAALKSAYHPEHGSFLFSIRFSEPRSPQADVDVDVVREVAPRRLGEAIVHVDLQTVRLRDGAAQPGITVHRDMELLEYVGLLTIHASLRR